jgi:putative aldouronate transport system permease protein
MQKTAPPSARLHPSLPTLRSLSANRQLYLMLLLPLAFIVIFRYVPLLGLRMAFLDYNPVKGFKNSDFVGLAVFQDVFRQRDFYRVLRNTLVLNGLDLVTGFPAPVILALLLNELRIQWFKRAAQTIIYVPHFLSWVIIAGIMYQLLSPVSGLVNIGLIRAGLRAVPFLNDKYMWVVSYNLIGVWQSIGWGTIIYLAAITGINPEIYEAATIDGAGRLRKVIHVTLPGITPTIVIMLIMQVGRLLSIGFERPYALYNPMVMETADVISTYVYRIGLRAFRYNVATAVGLFQSVAALVLVVAADRAAKRATGSGLF